MGGMFNRKKEVEPPASGPVDPDSHVTDPHLLTDPLRAREDDDKMKFREEVIRVLQSAFPGHEIIAKGVFDLVVQHGVRQFPVDLETAYHLMKGRPTEKPKILGGIINMVREQKSSAP
ncbi:MAG: hypothetical protein ACYCW6_17975 [Candidatus Xenobia bacterium]